ncbi:MAG: DUF3737 family protein [Lachnospiraceae bacterium]|nr:DUF3737 family protein [Lachnospiraceae bacterium]
MQVIEQQLLTEERALFGAKDLEIRHTIFDKGESPLKESADIELYDSMFRWKYPLWYAKHIKAVDCSWFEMARAGVWYTEDIVVENAMIEAPKNFRRCRDLTLRHVRFSNAAETLWSCDHVVLEDVFAKGDYFGMNTNHITVKGFELIGNYSFDGCSDVVVEDSRMLTKDAFWNCENVTVRNCFITGEYLGWNSKNLTLENCTIESLQGMCYIDNLVMRNCRLVNTTLAFEYSSVEADITGKIDSVFNPGAGTIKAEEIGELIIQKDQIDPEKTVIVCSNIGKHSDQPTF